MKLPSRAALLAGRISIAVALASPSLHAGAMDEYLPPGIEGHLTDPDHRVASGEKDHIEKRLGEIQEATHVDFAVFVANVDPADVERAGRLAYDTWGIGRDWETGYLLTLSESGQGCRVIVPRTGGVLSPAEVASVEAAATEPLKRGDFGAAIRAAIDVMGRNLRAHTATPSARPPGPKDVSRALAFAAGAVVVLAFSSVRSFYRRRSQRG